LLSGVVLGGLSGAPAVGARSRSAYIQLHQTRAISALHQTRVASTMARVATTPPATTPAPVAWLQPPPVLPIPSRSGPEGPPRPFGAEPSPGAQPTPTPRGLARAQNRALLNGPFPHSGLVRGVSEGTLLLNEDANVRELALQRIRETGATTVRIPVDWRAFVAATPPAGFEARDPASPAYRFATLDAAVESAAAAGLEPLLVVSHAPAFAEAPHRWPYAYPGSWAPSPAALEEFAAALAQRYDGAFPDPLAPAHALPRVRLFQAWNEPNLARYLEPQWVAEEGHWSAFSPLLYRQLLNGFYAGVKSVQPADVVVAAGVAPNGEPAGVGRMAPVTFLREMLCLAPTGQAGAARPAKRRSGAVNQQSSVVNRRSSVVNQRGSAGGRASGAVSHAGGASCPEPPHFNVLAFHPLSVGDPDLPAASSLDVSIADAAKVTGLLRQAEREGTALPAGGKPVWVTELNWESAPAPGGVPARLQAQWISRALHRLWVAGVGLVDWQFLIDPYPAERASTPTGDTIEYQRPAGLYSAGVGGDPASALPKPFLGGFTFPFDPLRVDRRQVRVWALLMRPRQAVVLQRWGLARPRGASRRPRRSPRQQGKAAWRTIARLRADRSGVLNVLVSLHGSARLRLASGALVSASAVVLAGPSRL
jgi:hypothetical protein